jgi:hypothetical protein
MDSKIITDREWAIVQPDGNCFIPLGPALRFCLEQTVINQDFSVVDGWIELGRGTTVHVSWNKIERSDV